MACRCLKSLNRDYLQGKKKSHKSDSQTMLSLLKKELREEDLQALFGGSSRVVPSSNVTPDPLLSSFISPIADDYGIIKKNTKDDAFERKVHQPPLSIKDQKEKAKRSEFVNGLMMSTILVDYL